jgi:hypothetical protein
MEIEANRNVICIGVQKSIQLYPLDNEISPKGGKLRLLPDS